MTSNWKMVDKPLDDQPVIRVIGLGGAGTNAVRYMMENGIMGVDFICANTDTKHLYQYGGVGVKAELINLGGNNSNGLGAGARPEVGRQAALDDRERLQEALRGSDMVFITAGMGGGTGTGSAPVVAEIAKELGALTVAVVTKPFGYEGPQRLRVAEEGLGYLETSVHSLVTIANDRLLEFFGPSCVVAGAFDGANEVLYGAVRGISDIATGVGFMNVDFEDVRTVMSVQGKALMGSGSASGEDRVETAIKMALECPLLEKVSVQEAGGVLVNISGSKDSLQLGELAMVGNALDERAAGDSVRVIGAQFDDSLGDEIRVTVVMTGIQPSQQLTDLTETTTQSQPDANSGQPAKPAEPASRRSGAVADPVAASVLEKLPSALK